MFDHNLQKKFIIDKDFLTLKKLMNDIGVNNDNIVFASYFKKIQ